MAKAKLRKIVYKYKALTKTWRTIINLRDKYQYFHWEIYNKIYFNYLIRIKGYKEITFDKKITNGMFKVFLRKDADTVIKIIRKDNPNSNKFYRRLKKASVYKEYHKTLTSMDDLAILDSHISKVNKVYKNGSYESPYIKGQNLEVLMLQMKDGSYKLSHHEYNELYEAINTLYIKLKMHYQEYGGLSGDWMLYNLMFDKETKNIINVDIEGFYTWDGNQIPNNMERIKNDLDNIINLIRLEEKEMFSCENLAGL